MGYEELLMCLEIFIYTFLFKFASIYNFSSTQSRTKISNNEINRTLE